MEKVKLKGAGVREALRAFMQCIYTRLEVEHDYLQSDDAISESIGAEVLRLHQLWFNNSEGGVYADLRGANLWGANLRGADLREADLWGANLREADLGLCRNLWPVALKNTDTRS